MSEWPWSFPPLKWPVPEPRPNPLLDILPPGRWSFAILERGGRKVLVCACPEHPPVTIAIVELAPAPGEAA